MEFAEPIVECLDGPKTPFIIQPTRAKLIERLDPGQFFALKPAQDPEPIKVSNPIPQERCKTCERCIGLQQLRYVTTKAGRNPP